MSFLVHLLRRECLFPRALVSSRTVQIALTISSLSCLTASQPTCPFFFFMFFVVVVFGVVGVGGVSSRKLFWECCYYCFVCCTYLGLVRPVGVHGDCPAGFLSHCTSLVIMSSVPGRHFVPKYTFRGHDPSASRGPVPKYTSLYTLMILFLVLWLCRRCSYYTIATCTVPKYTLSPIQPVHRTTRL